MAAIFLVAGLGFGDEGKGSICDFLVRQHQAPLVVRYNGGAQAAHSVVCDDGRHHTFSQFGSGTFAGARTFLSRFMILNPLTLLYEAKALEEKGVKDPLSLLTVERTALLTSPFHMAANRVREMVRGGGRHGSCGMGVGETMAHSLDHPSEALRVVDIELEPERARARLEDYRKRVVAELTPLRDQLLTQDVDPPPALETEWEMLLDADFGDKIIERYQEVFNKVEVTGGTWLHNRLRRQGSIVFEGAQGMLLDQDWGFAPHTTWTDCTFGNAYKLLDHTGADVTRIGVLRAYHTRHGAGPFPTEDKEVSVPASEHNGFGEWQQTFRMGHFDLVLAKYARRLMEINWAGTEQLAITCLDHTLDRPIRVCTQYTTSTGEKRAANGLSQTKFEQLGIRLSDPPSLQRQENMGYILGYMKPIYEDMPDVESFLKKLERELNVQVGICSFGPKASDKRTR
jgi:adenylosuccinate synthase